MTSIDRRVCLALAMAGLLLAAQRAEACSVAGPVPHVVDSSKQATDTTAPPPPVVTLQKIKRGQGPQGGPGCTSSASSCDDLGTLTLLITAIDEDTPRESIGYRMELVSGRLPEGFTLPGDSRPLAPPDQSGQITMYLHWGDGATDDQESFDFTLSVRAIDLGGNVGGPTMLRISDDPTGCSLVGARQSAPSLLMLTLAMLVLFRTSFARRASQN
ncbi:MAG TPA: hypothetical protein VFH73_24210 [Polyangia bacterium]|nr:hypothetical protein [Polyangia bacterium]